NHSLTEFERVPKGFCQPVQVWDPNANMGAGGPVSKTTCPVSEYFYGGPGFVDDTKLDSYQTKAVFTDLLQAAGHHVIKAGADFSFNSYRHEKGYTGGEIYSETGSGHLWNDSRSYGFLTGPDTPVQLNNFTARTTTISVGGFIQDSWSIMDKVTL